MVSEVCQETQIDAHTVEVKIPRVLWLNLFCFVRLSFLASVGFFGLRPAPDIKSLRTLANW